MTGPEHYREAERLRDAVTRRDALTGTRNLQPGDHHDVLALAQVHATLALAAATAVGILHDGKDMPIRDGEAWLAAAAIPRDTPRGGAA